MRTLKEFITESNINNTERKYREFCGMCKAYNVNPDDVTVCKTSKNNWRVYVDGKKVFLVSSNILNDEIIDSKGIKRCDESLNESSNKYEVIFMQYDADVQLEYETGDATEEDLQDSMYQNTKIDSEFINASNDNDAIRKATKILAKIVNKHPEIVAACVYLGNADDGDIVETIFI